MWLWLHTESNYGPSVDEFLKSLFYYHVLNCKQMFLILFIRLIYIPISCRALMLRGDISGMWERRNFFTTLTWLDLPIFGGFCHAFIFQILIGIP